MALVLHKIVGDGSVEHEPFTRNGWESAIRDATLLGAWGHAPDDCHDPVARHWARLRREGWECTEKQHKLADKDDPGWVGNRQLVKKPFVEPSPEEPVVWPPEVELKPWMLVLMTTMCLDDAKDALTPPRKELPKQEKRPLANSRGQFSLF